MNEVLLMIVITVLGIECRSVSVYFHHREKYEVRDEPERTFIDLPEEVVQLLDVGTDDDRTSKEDQLETELNKLPEINYTPQQISESSPTVSDTSEELLAISQNRRNNSGEIESSNLAQFPVSQTATAADCENNLKEDYENRLNFNDDADDDDDENGDNEDDGENSKEYDEPEIEKPVDKFSTDVDDVKDNDDAVDLHSRRRHYFRFKRDAGYQQWQNSLPGYEMKQHEEDIVWEEVTDEDITRAKYGEIKQTAKFVGLTLLSVTFFVFIGYCFIRDPVAFVFAFGTGCPCCIICCPCIRKFTDKYLNVKKIIRDSMNRYMPGVIIKDDGTFDTYEPTSDELAIMEEIINEIME